MINAQTILVEHVSKELSEIWLRRGVGGGGDGEWEGNGREINKRYEKVETTRTKNDIRLCVRKLAGACER